MQQLFHHTTHTQTNGAEAERMGSSFEQTKNNAKNKK